MKIKLTALVIILSLCLCSCTKQTSTNTQITQKVTARNTITDLSQNTDTLHYSRSQDAFGSPVASSGFIELLIDPVTTSFAIHEKSTNTIRSALPLLSDLIEGEEKQNNASMATVTIAGGTDIYILNTQDNSVQYQTNSYKLIENGAEFIFNIFPDKKTADKTTFSSTDIGFEIKITALLQDGSLFITCSQKNITQNPDAYIEKIELLNYFGAYNDTTAGNFLLLPDGCGAIVDTSVYDDAFDEVKLKVYSDIASANNSDCDGAALAPVFAIKQTSCAIASIIEEAQASCTIVAHKGNYLGDYNRIYPSFTIHSVLYENETLYIGEKTQTDNIKICYRFLTGKNASYQGCAGAMREQLIRDNILKSSSVEDSEWLPFFLTLKAAEKKKFGPITYYEEITDFEKAQDMLVTIKGKGINNVYLRYMNVLTGADKFEDCASSTIINSCGGISAFKKLYTYTSSQRTKLFLNLNLLSSTKPFKSGNATNFTGKEISFNGCYLRKIGDIESAVLSVLSTFKEESFNGFCLDDVSNYVYDGYNEDITLKEAINIVSSQILPLTVGKDTMANRGNFYSLKNTNAIINLPLTAQAVSGGSYQSVPLLEIILHGIYDYSSEAINLQINSTETMLKCIEYGACPHYEWNYSSSSDDDSYYYDNTINSASEFYERANTALNDLRSSKITDHYEISDGVFCTHYDTGAIIYVNYTDKEFSANGVTVEGSNFIRIG